MEKNVGVKEAKDELKHVSGDYEIRRIAELKQKYIRDEKAALSYAIEEGTKQGIAKGIAQGIAEGIEKGEKESKVSIAKKLLKKGMMIEEVMEVTELTYDEIIKLKE